MSNKIIRTGIIGASIHNGWASGTHIPAIEHLDEFKLTAVGTSNMESAKKAQKRSTLITPLITWRIWLIMPMSTWSLSALT